MTTLAILQDVTLPILSEQLESLLKMTQKCFYYVQLMNFTPYEVFNEFA